MATIKKNWWVIAIIVILLLVFFANNSKNKDCKTISDYRLEELKDFFRSSNVEESEIQKKIKELGYCTA